MGKRKYIKIKEVAEFCCVEVEVFKDFADFGLISVCEKNEEAYIVYEDIGQIKEIFKLYTALGMNKEGIKMFLQMREQIQNLIKERDYFEQKMVRLEKEYKLKAVEFPQEQGFIIDVDID